MTRAILALRRFRPDPIPNPRSDPDRDPDANLNSNLGTNPDANAEAQVVLTDLHENLPRLREAVLSNGADGAVSVEALDWSEPVPAGLSTRPWDFILAADCVFWTDLFTPLLKTLAELVDATDPSRDHHCLTTPCPTRHPGPGYGHAPTLQPNPSPAPPIPSDDPAAPSLLAPAAPAPVPPEFVTPDFAPLHERAPAHKSDHLERPQVLLTVTSRLDRAAHFAATAEALGWTLECVHVNEAPASLVQHTSLLRLKRKRLAVAQNTF